MSRSSISPQYRIYILFQQSMEAREAKRRHQVKSTTDLMSLYEELKLALLRNQEMLSSDETQVLNTRAIVQIFQILANHEFEWCDIPQDDREIFLKTLHDYFDFFSPIDIALTTWAIGRLGVNIHRDTTPIFQHALLSAIKNNISKFNHQGCSNIMWAFVALDFDFESIRDICMTLVMRIRIALEKDHDFSQADERHLAQVKDFIAYYHDQFPESIKAMLNEVNNILDNRLRRQVSQSSFTHSQIAQLIQRYCADAFYNEFRIAGSPVDICFPNPDQRVVLEVDGRQHFNAHNKLDVHTQIRQRIVEKCGFTVFRIDCRQWSLLSDERQIDFIKLLLLTAGLRVRAIPLLPELAMDILLRALPAPTPSPSTEEETTQPPNRTTASSAGLFQFKIVSKKRKIRDEAGAAVAPDEPKSKCGRYE